MQQPWTRWVNPKYPDRVMVMMQRNYKVFADIGTTTASRTRTFTILDTGAGNNFIREDALPAGYEPYLKLGHLPNVCDANGNRLDMIGVTNLQVELGGYRLELDFIVCTRLEAACILGTHFCDRFVVAIRPKDNRRAAQRHEDSDHPYPAY